MGVGITAYNLSLGNPKGCRQRFIKVHTVIFTDIKAFITSRKCSIRYKDAAQKETCCDVFKYVLRLKSTEVG